jgi:hypothetical protein
MTLGGKEDWLDTPLEFALLSYYSQPVINIRPVQANAILPKNDPRTAGLKLGSAVLKELAELKFLDPSNTAAIGRYEGMIKFISDKDGVSRAEIESYYRQGIGALIAETVDAEFNKVRFGLGDYSTDKYYNATLTCDTSNKYVLSYEGYFSGIKQTKQITAPSLSALLTEMKSGANRADFDQRCIDQVNAENANIPAVFLERIGKDPRAALTDIITEFYLNPTNQTVYGTVRDVNVFYDVAAGVSDNPVSREMYETIGAAYINTLTALSPELKQRVENDSRGRTSVTLTVDVRNRLQFASLRQ